MIYVSTTQSEWENLKSHLRHEANMGDVELFMLSRNKELACQSTKSETARNACHTLLPE